MGPAVWDGCVTAEFDRETIGKLVTGLDTLRVGVSYFDADDRLAYCNEHFRFVYRSFETVKSLIGRTFEELVRVTVDNGEIAGKLAILDPEAYIQERVRYHRLGTWVPLEERLSDGRWIEIKERPLPGGGYIGLWSDITGLKRSQQRLEDAIESTADGFALWDQADKLSVCNQRFRDLHGGKPEIGQRFKDYIEDSLESGAFVIEGEPRIWRTHRFDVHRLPVGIIEMQTAQGAWYLVKDRRTRDGGVATVFTDITDLKSKELALESRREGLERIVEELGQSRSRLADQSGGLASIAAELHEARVAADRAHEATARFMRTLTDEVRTPLNAIIGFTDLMTRQMFGPLGNDRYREYASLLHACGAHLLDVVNSVLDLAKIESGRYELFPTPVAIGEVLDACIVEVEGQAKAAGIELVMDVPASLPLAKADRTASRQVMLNVLSNAVKFTPPGGRVELGVETGGGAMRIIVRDSGIGIRPEDLERVLLPFEHAGASPAGLPQGAGLGLPIAKSLIELQGGSLLLESHPTEGTTVIITLPLA